MRTTVADANGFCLFQRHGKSKGVMVTVPPVPKTRKNVIP
jgi:hypothetical protein